MATCESLHAVVLAGGLGTRLRRVLAGKPKPMVEVAGRPFLDWVILYLRRQGCTHFSLATGYQAEMVAEHFQRQPIDGVQVRCFAEPTPLGTAGGFRFAAELALRAGAKRPDAWLVLNGDSLFLAELAPLLQRWRTLGTSGAILARWVDDVHRYGMLSFDEQHRLLRFAEKMPGAEAKAGWINAGVYVLADARLEQFPRQDVLSFEVDVFPTWLRAGLPLSVLTDDAPFLDIGTEETLAQAEAFVREHGKSFS